MRDVKASQWRPHCHNSRDIFFFFTACVWCLLCGGAAPAGWLMWRVHRSARDQYRTIRQSYSYIRRRSYLAQHKERGFLCGVFLFFLRDGGGGARCDSISLFIPLKKNPIKKSRCAQYSGNENFIEIPPPSIIICHWIQKSCLASILSVCERRILFESISIHLDIRRDEFAIKTFKIIRITYLSYLSTSLIK